MEKSEKVYVGWLDWLRVFACFLVVLAHCCDHFVAQFGQSMPDFMAGVSWGSFYRPCVPLFTMMTGFLMLPSRSDMLSFYKRKMPRLLIPFGFWLIAGPLLFYAYFATGVQTASPCIIPNEHGFMTALQRIACSVFNFNYSVIPLWYIYMLVGLYLFIPILSAFLKQASRKELRVLLALWGVTLCLPYVQMFAPFAGYTGNYGNMGLLGVCDWNPFGMFYYFSGFMGYLVLGYYLKKYPLQWSWTKTLALTLPMWLIGYAWTLAGFLKTQQIFPGDFSKLEIVWYFNSINVLMMTAPIFIWFQKANGKTNSLVRLIASLSFGIFLSHFVFVQLVYDFLYPILPIPAFLKIPVQALVTFALTFAFVLLFRLNKRTRILVE